MNHYSYIQNISQTVPSFSSLIKEIEGNYGKAISANAELRKNPLYSDSFELWDRAMFNYDSVLWENFYPGIHYQSNIASDLESLLGVRHIRSWVSKINPGCCTPWHYDIDDHEQEYLRLGNLKRFIVTVNDPAPGHVFMIENEYLQNYRAGDLFLWKDYKAYHAGMNAGLTPKYLYNFLSYISSSV
jgi:hypothetical protein